MIDIDFAIENFIKYSQNYDLSNENIKRKQLHSIRVMNLCEKIAKSINLNEEQVRLARLVGLLHDIARFEQFTQYKTFHDADSFDHGDYGAKILEKDIRNYIKEDNYDDLIIKAVKNHNKYMIEDKLDEEELVYAKIVRDADKIDIIYEWIDIFWKNKEYLVEKSVISDYVYEEFKSEKLIKRLDKVKFSEVEALCTTIAFIFDINYIEGYRILKKEDYINKIIKRFNFENSDTKERIKKIQVIANNYIDKKIREN